jgi:hypothetical protein
MNTYTGWADYGADSKRRIRVLRRDGVLMAAIWVGDNNAIYWDTRGGGPSTHVHFHEIPELCDASIEVKQRYIETLWRMG